MSTSLGSPAAFASMLPSPLLCAQASLVQQWAKEVTKWLGSERLSAIALLQSPDAPRIVAEFQVSCAEGRRLK